MDIERLHAGTCAPPFPIYDDLVPRFLAAHAGGQSSTSASRDAAIAHALATCAGYSYSDTKTVASMMAALGLGGGACVRVAQTVDAMFVFSTAFLVQSKCGRVVVLCYRGTEPTNLGNWFGNADVGPDEVALAGEQAGFHSGFYRNVRTTRRIVIEELNRAIEGRSLADPTQRVEHPMEALYLTGHSLGGAMAVLFAISTRANHDTKAIADRLRAVYTFGQPMALAQPLTNFAREVGQRVFRHVMGRDIIPALPPAQSGDFAHVGHEYVHADGEWHPAGTPVSQLKNMRDIPGSLLSVFATPKRAASARYALGDHGPHRYIGALRPEGRITEFGDWS
ncbi:MAG: lipase family protein [Gemmatimonadaceae bacterium]